MAAKHNLISIFGENNMKYFEGIDYESFINLQPHHIKEAIPNLIPRIKFENQYKNFLKTVNDKQSLTVASSAHPSILEISDIIDTNEAEVTDYNNSDDPMFEENFAVFNVHASNETVTTNSNRNSRNDLKKKTVIKTPQDIIDIPNIDLKIIITKCINQQRSIENHDRVLIGKAIIQHLLVNDFERMLTRAEFICITEAIVQLFPNEIKGIYYTPAGKNYQAQGKLYSAYQNYKTLLREVNLIKTRGKALNRTVFDEGFAADIAQLKEKSEALKFAFEEVDDFHQVKECWKLCYNERQKLLNELSIFEYMRRFPSFDLPTGYELLQLDSDILHVNKISKLPKIAPKIFAFASKQKRLPLEVKSLLVAYNELSVDINEDSSEALKQFTAIRLLPYLMPRPKRKYSKSEIANLFCSHFKTAFEADAHNIKFTEHYKETTLILKPRIYFVGDNLNPCAHIIIGSKKYIVEDSISGFELLFKSFSALKCPYPDETQHIWQFIESEVYEIETAGEKQAATVLAFIQDIKTIIIN